MNKGILCATCNGTFSPLDLLLKNQLNMINGLLGVRPDHDDEPQTAHVDSPIGTLAVDHAGRPNYARPVLVGERPHEDGRKIVEMKFSNQKQVDAWLAKQRKAGLNPVQLRRTEASHYLPGPFRIEWSFGGAEAFREIGRIALNFVATAWPERARATELRPFKDWVLGQRVTAGLEPKHVWYADDSMGALPDATFEFGHQILVVFDAQRGEAYGRVRFFSTFDLCVWFGAVTTDETVATLYEIDPLADHPPNDLIVTPMRRFPVVARRAASEEENVGEQLRARMRTLLDRIQDRQWRFDTVGLLGTLNATRLLTQRRRMEAIRELLEPHTGRVLMLAREVAEHFRALANADPTNEAAEIVADGLAHCLTTDSASTDGLSPQARAAIALGTLTLAITLATELERNDLTDDQLREYLCGGLGMHAVGTALTDQIAAALQQLEADS